MTRPNRASPFVALALMFLAGCVSGGGTPLEQAQNALVRELTSQCYRYNEGHRAVFGGYVVHSACRRWASERVQAKFPRHHPWGS